MGWIQLFREDNSPTNYESVEIPAEWNIPLLWIAFIAIVASIGALLWACGLKHARIRIFLRDVIALGIGISILVSIYGLSWQTGMVRTKYRSGNHTHPPELIELNLGLLGFNVSYTGERPDTGKIFLNEYIAWYPVERLHEDYMSLVKKGTPDPVLDFCELFVFEGGNIHWGRNQRTSGYYSYILSWSSFALWAMGALYMQASGIYGSMLLIFAGCLELLANVSYYAANLQNDLIFKLHFQGGKLDLQFGWCFWLTLATGFFCVGIGTLVLVMTICHPELTQSIFLYTSAQAIWRYDQTHLPGSLPNAYEDEHYQANVPPSEPTAPSQTNRSTRVKFTGDTELRDFEKEKRLISNLAENCATAVMSRSLPASGALLEADNGPQELFVKISSKSSRSADELQSTV